MYIERTPFYGSGLTNNRKVFLKSIDRTIKVLKIYNYKSEFASIVTKSVRMLTIDVKLKIK